MSLKEKWTALVAREKEKTKNMTFKKKVEYIAGNWWAEILCVLAAIGVVVGCGAMIFNTFKDRILYFAVVDVSLSEEECQTILDDFETYIGNTSPMKIVDMDPYVSSLGALPTDTAIMPEASDDQQKSLLLIGSGLLDAYICTQEYAEFLLGYDDLDKAENVLGPELAEQYADRITMDGHAVDLTGTDAAAMFGVGYEPCYLVFTPNHVNHFPEVVQSFAQYLLEKT